MLNLIKKLNNEITDIIFVGGVSEMIQGIRETTKDIDICVLNVDELKSRYILKEWQDTSVFSKSGKRAGIESEDYIIDIFIEDTLPDFIEIDGVKCETLNSLIDRYKLVIEGLDDNKDFHSKEKMIKKLNNLLNKIKDATIN